MRDQFSGVKNRLVQPVKNRVIYSLLIMSLLFWGASIFAEPLDWLQKQGVLEAQYLYENRPGLSAEQVAALPDEAFRPLGNPNFGYRREAIWLRVRVHRPAHPVYDFLAEPSESRTETDQRIPALLPLYYLQIEYPLLDAVVLHRGKHERMQSGRSIPYTRRSYPHRNAVFPLNISTATEVLHIRVQSEDSISIPLVLQSAEEFQTSDRNMRFLFGLYYGIIAIMLVYNLFLYFSVRYLGYLWYVLTLFFLHGCFQISLNGFWSEIFAPAYSWPPGIKIGLAFALGSFMAILFAREFLQTAELQPRFDKFMKVALWIPPVLSVLSITLDYFYVIYLTISFGLMVAVALFLAGVLVYRTGLRPARYFLLAWSFLLIGGSIYALKALGILPTNVWTEFSWQAGSAIEACLLSLALGDRLKTIRQEVRHARFEAASLGREAMRSRETLERQTRSLERFRVDLLAIQEQTPSLQALLARILRSLRDILEFERGFIAIADQDGRSLVHNEGDFPDLLRDMLPARYFNEYLLSVPEDLHKPLSEMLFLSEDVSSRFEALMDKGRTSITKVTKVLQELKRARFQWVIPLSF